VLAGWVATALILIALPIVSFATWPVFDPSATAPQASIVTEDGQELSCAGAQRITAEITTEYLDPGKAGSLSQLQTISSKMAALEADDRILAASYGPELPWHFQTLHDAIRLALSLSNRGVIGASDQELSEALREGPVPYLIKQIEDVCKSS
jgi:hypothetical protein